MRDMQNKKHPPLANVLPLSSFGFLILSSLFFFFSLEGIFLKSFADTESKTMAILLVETENKEEGDSKIGRERECVCVRLCDCNYERSLRWWMDRLACFKPAVAKRQRVEEGAVREDGC